MGNIASRSRHAQRDHTSSMFTDNRDIILTQGGLMGGGGWRGGAPHRDRGGK